jgi:hypothetical protein
VATRHDKLAANGMETITTGHFQLLACRHSLSVHLTGLTCDGCAECFPA